MSDMMAGDADTRDEGGTLGVMLGEALAISLLIAAWIAVTLASSWLAAIHPIVPLIFQALLLTGATAMAMVSFRPWSGGHVNPLMTFVLALDGHVLWRRAVAISIAHILAACVALTFATAYATPLAVPPMTDLRLIGEWAAGFVLIYVAVVMRNEPPVDAALWIGAVVGVCYALSGGVTMVNPAIALAQSFLDYGVNTTQVGPIMVAQFAGAATGLGVARLIWHAPRER